MDLTLAIMWSVALVADIICMACGGEASWILVFCPLIILVLDKWERYFENR